MTTRTECRLAPGEIFDGLAGPRGEGWRLVEGALRLDPVAGTVQPALLALPGDLLGLETSALGRCPYRLRALLPARLQALVPAASPAEACARLGTMLDQQWRRAVQMTGLRTGGVPDRVKHLLVLLRACGSDGDLLMPRLRDLAGAALPAGMTSSRPAAVAARA